MNRVKGLRTRLEVEVNGGWLSAMEGLISQFLEMYILFILKGLKAACNT